MESNNRAAFFGWALVFEQETHQSGAAEDEVISALMNISSMKDEIDDVVEQRLRQAMRGSPILAEKRVRAAIRSFRAADGTPKDEWWWWPEKIT